jgi:hypothetical protein
LSELEEVAQVTVLSLLLNHRDHSSGTKNPQQFVLVGSRFTEPGSPDPYSDFSLNADPDPICA